MSLTDYQRRICRLLAANRIRIGESYVAGGAALNEILRSPRQSHDLDLFHDTDEALAASWDSDRRLLLEEGYAVEVLRERPTFIEARVGRGEDRTVVQWARDSAYRFFPLLEHPDFGLTLHPFDHATNKVLALAGRLEPRDWVDAIRSAEEIQPLGLLIWAASGKDPGLSPPMILSEARRARYSAVEIGELAFLGKPPDAAALSRRWAAMVSEARTAVDILPAERVGTCILDRGGNLFRADPGALRSALEGGGISFHEGSIGGAFPRFLG